MKILKETVAEVVCGFDTVEERNIFLNTKGKMGYIFTNVSGDINHLTATYKKRTSYEEVFGK